MKEILVTGGAGYIGSHTMKALEAKGFLPVCFDNLSTGFRSFAGTFPFVRGDLANPAEIESVFSAHSISAVIHFASHALVGESYGNPHKYYHDNIMNAMNLLQAMRGHNVRLIVFSSTCATYGIPAVVPISEIAPLDPVNPYGVTKMVVERMLRDYDRAYGIRFVALRYFNAAGASPDATLGEYHSPETHLIPRLLDVAAGLESAAEVYGGDYPTPDGTCLRDYISVTDLAEAHATALEYLFANSPSDVFNLGTGRGDSVLEVIRQVVRTTSKTFPVNIMPRRPGDPPSLVADPSKARVSLGWRADHSSLAEIVETAWNWHQVRAERIKQS